LVTSDLSPDSPLYDLPKDQFSLSAQSFIKFEFLPVSDLPKANWIFFASPRSVESIAEKQSLKNFRLACLGSGTAVVLEKFGYSPDYVGKGSAEEAVLDFANSYPHGKVLVPHGNQSVGTVTRILSEERCIPLLTYKTLPKPTQLNRIPDVVVFTSPSNVRSFLSRNPWPRRAVVAIGTTTENALLKSNPKVDVYVASEPTHSALKRLLINRFAKR
jgi:uroporphyrinogen-III synthase